ncbi:MAG: D-alanyl-D-alanine carboxypeptidase family protein [Clostridia bacterium]|nr:D-alanyl-D-alanine carboxypeptidase family protein [Clostridia bacterium]
MDFLDKIDRQKLQRITLVVIAALTLLATVLLVIIIIASVEGGTQPNDNSPNVENIDDIQFESKTVSGSELLKGSLVLANSNHTYTMPSDVNLVNIATYRSEHDTSIPYSVGDIYNFYLASDAIEYAHNMLIALKSDTGNDSIMISSACGKNDASSDVHAGYTIALTVVGGVSPYLSDESNADLANWLRDNAHKYGFVVRYPADKAESTGVSDYTYAFRFVGVAHAQYMKDNNLCLEEYIEYLKKETSYKDMLTVKASDGASYAVYYTSVSGDSGEIKVPVQTPNPDGSTSFPYTISGTNEGGVIVTIKLN